MKGDLRCVDGRIFQHEPCPDDPGYEFDIGRCPDCEGDGCEEEPVDKPRDILAYMRDPD